LVPPETRLKSFHKTLIFAFITLSLTAYVYLFEYKSAYDNEVSSQKQIVKFSSDQVNFLQIVKGDSKISLQKDQTGWNLNEPILEDADNEVVNDLIATLGAEKQVAVVKLTDSKFSENDLAEFGLDKPLAIFNFRNNGGITEQVAVGAIKNFEGQSYLQVDNGSKIIIGNSVWYTKAEAQLIDYRDKRLFRENMAAIERMKLSTLQESFELKKSDNKWVSSQHNYMLDQNQIRDIIRKIVDSKIESYVFEGEPSQSLLKDKELDKAAVSVELFTESSSWLAKMNVSKKDNSLYLLSDRPTYLAKVSPLLWETVSVLNLDRLRDRSSAFQFNAEEVKKIYYKSNDRETNLILNSGSWLMGSSNSPYLEVDKAEMAKTIKRIHDLRISEFIDTDVKDKFVGQNMLIIKSETEKLLLQLNWGPSFKLTKNGEEKEYFYARTQLSDRIFALEKSAIDNLNLQAEKIVKKTDKVENANPPEPAATEK
jgi:predicted metal-binding transcription factor (methanogenesis marker protein 9)